MLFQLKLIVFCWTGLALGLFAWNYVASRESRRVITRTHVVGVFALTGIMFIQTNIYVWFIVSTMIPAIVAVKTKKLSISVVAFTILTFRISYAVNIGGLYLGYLNTTTFVVLGVILALPFVRQKHPIPFNPGIDSVIVALAVMLILISLRDPGNVGRTIFETVVAIVLPYLILRVAIRTKDDVHAVQIAVVFAAIMLAGNALIETLWRWPIYHTSFGLYGIDSPNSAYARSRGGFMRIPTMFGESTSFGVFLGLAIAFAATNPRIFRSRGRQSIAVAIISAVIIVTFSRSAVVAGLCAVLLSMFYRGQVGRSITGIALLVGMIAGALALADISAGIAQYVKPGAAGNIFDYRELFWRDGIKVVQAHPLSGVSAAQMLALMPRLVQYEGFIDPVNAYLYFAIRGGVFAALVFLLATLIPLISLWVKRLGAPDSHERRLKAGLFGATSSLLLALAGTAFTERNPTWILLCAACAAAAVARPQRRRALEDTNR
jgi:O-Antigen ligase